MLWLVSGILLLVGALVQAIQALLAYRRTFSKELEIDSGLVLKELADLRREVAKRTADEEALAARLDSEGADEMLEKAYAQLKELSGQSGLPMPDSLETFIEQHRDRIKGRAEELGKELPQFCAHDGSVTNN